MVIEIGLDKYINRCQSAIPSSAPASMIDHHHHGIMITITNSGTMQALHAHNKERCSRQTFCAEFNESGIETAALLDFFSAPLFHLPQITKPRDNQTLLISQVEKMV